MDSWPITKYTLNVCKQTNIVFVMKLFGHKKIFRVNQEGATHK